MESRIRIGQELQKLFRMEEWSTDPAFSRFIPIGTGGAIIEALGAKIIRPFVPELLGAQAYITGEIHCHIDNPYGRQRYAQMMDYVPSTSLSLIGVSHSASEYLVMKTQMKLWFERNFPAVNVRLLPQEKW